MKPLGQIITGVQNTIFLSLTTALLSLRLIFEAAEATEPASKLLASLIMDSSLLEDLACDPEELTFAFRCLGGIVKIIIIKFKWGLYPQLGFIKNGCNSQIRLERNFTNR